MTAPTEAKVCAVVPTYDNPHTVRGVVERIRAHGLDVIVIDDGSDTAGRDACRKLVEDRLATVIRHEVNRGKGAACKSGFAHAREHGFTHAFQIDADGQHDIDQIPAFLAAMQQQPQALVLGYPVYDDTAPPARKFGRSITDFWVAVEVGSRSKIKDAMIGFRIYPLAAVERLPRLGNRMEFDIEIAVQLVNAGVETINLPVAVRYLSREEGGVSHFRPFADNLRFAYMHSRICTLACMRWTFRKVWPFRKRSATVS